MRRSLFHFLLALLLTFAFTAGGMHAQAFEAASQEEGQAEMSISDCHGMAVQNDIAPEKSGSQKHAAYDCGNCLGCACSALLSVLAGSTLFQPVMADQILQAPLAGQALPVDPQPPRTHFV